MTEKDESLKIRLERAGSWIRLAKKIEEAVDKLADTSKSNPLPKWARQHELFIFYWIALNALYGTSRKLRLMEEGAKNTEGKGSDEWDKEKAKIRRFLNKVVEMAKKDGSLTLKAAVNEECLRAGELVIKDRFLDRDYWEDRWSVEDVDDKCSGWRKDVLQKEGLEKFKVFFDHAFEHLLVLRNQIMHGSASHGPESEGKNSLLPGLAVMRSLVPAFYRLTKEFGHTETWGEVPYPRFSSDLHHRKTIWQTKFQKTTSRTIFR